MLVWFQQHHTKEGLNEVISYIIRDEKGYQHLSERVRRGGELLESKWIDPAYEKEISHYNAMACALLEWEIDNDIFEPKFDKWLEER